MCELFCLSSRHPTRATFSLRHFATHGAPDTRNIDGWGVAFRDGRDARLYKEPAGDNPLLGFIERHLHPTHLLISHIRHATVGETDSEKGFCLLLNRLLKIWEGAMAPSGLWVRYRRCSGAHAAAIAPPAASGVIVHHEEYAASDAQEMTPLASVPVTVGHWSPLAGGEVVVASAGKIVERAGA